MLTSSRGSWINAQQKRGTEMTTTRVECGRIVKYCIGARQYRPAMVVEIHGPGADGQLLCNLIVFMDGSNDAQFGGSGQALIKWATSVMHGEEIHQWLWPEELRNIQTMGAIDAQASSS